MDRLGAPVTSMLRAADASDAPAVAQLYVASWNAGFAGLMPSRQLDDALVARWQRELAGPAPHRWWVAEVDGAVVGFAGIGPSRDPSNPKLGELDTIAVEPGLWRRGIGRTLMAEAVCSLAADGYEQGVLWTLAGLEPARRFYETCGWKPDGGTRDEGRQICYRCRLASGSQLPL